MGGEGRGGGGGEGKREREHSLLVLPKVHQSIRICHSYVNLIWCYNHYFL